MVKWGQASFSIGTPLGTHGRRGLRGHNVSNGVPPLVVMNAEEIRATLYEIAAKSPDNATAALVRQLGDLMFARLQHTTETHTAINENIEALRTSFEALAQALAAQAKTNERQQSDKIRQMIDRVHTLSNRFMAVEDKTDQAMQLLDLRFEEILEAISGQDDGTNERTTTD